MVLFKEANPNLFPMVNFEDLFNWTWSWTSMAWDSHQHMTLFTTWDYDSNEFYASPISDNGREFFRWWARVYQSGLLDPELNNDQDRWTSKLALGESVVTHGFHDMLYGVNANSEIEGFDLRLALPLEGPGPNGQFVGRVGQIFNNYGITIPMTTYTNRDDFEELIQAVDTMFYSEETAIIWNVGVEGVTWDMVNGAPVLRDHILNSPDGIIKHIQVNYGSAGAMFWYVREAKWNMVKLVGHIVDVNEALDIRRPNGGWFRESIDFPALPDREAEQAGLIMGALRSAYPVWMTEFLTGTKCLDAD
jgi:putative aldouronate transport system substrate-binding protein